MGRRIAHALPAWRLRQLKEKERQTLAEPAGQLEGTSFAEAVWSNTSQQPFCLTCEPYAPGSTIVLILPAGTGCTCCGRPVGDVAIRRAS